MSRKKAPNHHFADTGNFAATNPFGAAPDGLGGTDSAQATRVHNGKPAERSGRATTRAPAPPTRAAARAVTHPDPGETAAAAHENGAQAAETLDDLVLAEAPREAERDCFEYEPLPSLFHERDRDALLWEELEDESRATKEPAPPQQPASSSAANPPSRTAEASANLPQGLRNSIAKNIRMGVTVNVELIKRELADRWDTEAFAPYREGIVETDPYIRANFLRQHSQALRAIACICSAKEFAPGQSGRHDGNCPLSTFPKDTRKDKRAHDRQLAQDASAEANPDVTLPSEDWSGFVEPMSVEDLLALNLAPHFFIPKQAKHIVALAGTVALTAPRDAKWWLLIAFCKLVLTARGSEVRVVGSLVARARQFIKRDFDALLREAKATSEANNKAAKAREAPAFAPGTDAPRGCVYTQPDAFREQPTKEAIEKCIKLVHGGQVSRGAAALSASPIAPFTKEVLDELRDKHPAANGTGITDEQRENLRKAAAPREVTAQEVVRCLRTFPPGSAAGPYGLRPSVLLSLMMFPGSPLYSVVPSMVHELMSGDVPERYRPFYYGASLVPLVKNDKALRPIACSEVLRRIAAKILAGRLSSKFRAILTAAGQIGVAV